MPHSGWQITSQSTNQIENDNAGRTIVGTRVYFITGDGNEGSVFVPDVHYTTRRVREMVRAEATLIDEVGALTENAG
jgi:ssDNA-binding replication factor A large subunit